MELHKITCPKCQHTFQIESVLAKDVEEKLKAEFNARFKEVTAKKYAQIEAENKEKQQALEIALREKLAKDYELQIKAQQQELEEQSAKIQAFKLKELELAQKERKLSEDKQNAEIELQKRFLDEKERIAHIVREKLEAEYLLKDKEKDMKLEQLKAQMEIMKKKMEQGSMQLQGEVQEIALETLLKQTFPFDAIEEISVGTEGADVAQTVKNMLGKSCGVILYESKRTKTFSEKWIEKLKNDLRSHKADIAIIVTATMPKDMTKFGQKEGVWICNIEEVKGVASVLREMLIKLSEAKNIEENKGDKMQILYQYLTSNQFKQHIEAIVEGFTDMQNGLLKERTAMERIWKEREKQIEKVLQSTAGMYGSIKGIAGSSVSDIPLLEM